LTNLTHQGQLASCLYSDLPYSAMTMTSICTFCYK